MAITKQQKEVILKDATNALQGASSAVFVHAKGLKVNDSNAMRGEMKTEGVDYKVLKKTLLAKALDSMSPTGERPVLEGEIAVAYGEDLVAPARLVSTYAKKHKENMAIVGGVFDGRYMNQAEMTEIAEIPATPVLRGMFVNVINSPIQGLAIVLDALAQKREAAS